MGAFTRSALKSRARSRADQENSDFPSDAQYNEYLDESCNEVLMDLVTAGWPVDYSTTTIVTNGVTRTYAFGDPLAGTSGHAFPMAAILVYTNVGGQVQEVKRVNPSDVPALRSTGAVASFSPYYEVRTSPTSGPIIEFFPKKGGTYFVDYIDEWPGFVTDGGNPFWSGPARSDELIVLRTAAKGVRKEGRIPDGQALDTEYDRLLVKVKAFSSWFDMRNPAEIRNSANLLTPSTWNGEFFAGPGGLF